MHNTKCFSSHMGLYAIQGEWLKGAVACIKSDLWDIRSVGDADALRESQKMQIVNGVAVLPIHGSMMKGFSKFGGASTVETRRQLRAALKDDAIKGIMLHVDSPGGTVAGTKELADDVAAAAGTKPVHTFIEDLGASAAFWVSSQSNHITANATAEVGSIGTVAVVEDFSGAAEMQGIKVHVISTGPHKGAFVSGALVEDSHLADLQRRIDDLNEHFQAAVRTGRSMDDKSLARVSDGRVFIASKAQSLGLIDEVGTFQSAMETLMSELPATGAPSGRASRRRSLAVEVAKRKNLD